MIENSMGALIDLVVLDEEVVAKTNWYNWFNDEKTTKHMQKHYFPNTMGLQLEIYSEITKDKRKMQLGVVVREDKCMIGVVSIQDIDFINRNAEFSLLIGENEYRRLIYSQEAIKLILEHGFFTLNLHKIYCGYLDTLSVWGLFLIKRFKFKDEGIWREHAFKNGKYLNIHRLGLLRNEYLRLIKKENENENER